MMLRMAMMLMMARKGFGAGGGEASRKAWDIGARYGQRTFVLVDGARSPQPTWVKNRYSVRVRRYSTPFCVWRPPLRPGRELESSQLTIGCCKYAHFHDELARE